MAGVITRGLNDLHPSLLTSLTAAQCLWWCPQQETEKIKQNQFCTTLRYYHALSTFFCHTLHKLCANKEILSVKCMTTQRVEMAFLSFFVSFSKLFHKKSNTPKTENTELQRRQTNTTSLMMGIFVRKVSISKPLHHLSLQHINVIKQNQCHIYCHMVQWVFWIFQRDWLNNS